MAIQDALEGEGAASVRVEHQGLVVALKAFSLVASDWWHAPILTLLALRSHGGCQDSVRLPAYLVPLDTDVLLLRQLISALFDVSSVNVQALSQTTLVQLFALTGKCLFMDLSSATDGLAPTIRRLAIPRSIPGNVVALKQGDALAEVPIYGDSVLIVPDTFSSGVGQAGLVLEIVQPDTPLPLGANDCLTNLMAARSLLKELAARVSSSGVSTGLPAQRFIDAPARHGFVLLMELAQAADKQLAGARFQDAVLAAWLDMAARMRRVIPARVFRAILCGHILGYLDENPKPNCNGGYREDLLCVYVRAADPELFSELNPTELGKMISRLRLGRCGRRALYNDSKDKGAPARIWRSYTIFDRTRLQEVASVGLQEEVPPQDAA